MVDPSVVGDVVSVDGGVVGVEVGVDVVVLDEVVDDEGVVLDAVELVVGVVVGVVVEVTEVEGVDVVGAEVVVVGGGAVASVVGPTVVVGRAVAGGVDRPREDGGWSRPLEPRPLDVDGRSSGEAEVESPSPAAGPAGSIPGEAEAAGRTVVTSVVGGSLPRRSPMATTATATPRATTTTWPRTPRLSHRSARSSSSDTVPGRSGG